jgi:hypothetical protein
MKEIQLDYMNWKQSANSLEFSLKLSDKKVFVSEQGLKDVPDFPTVVVNVI